MKRKMVILFAGKAKDVSNRIAALAQDQGDKTLGEVMNDNS